MRIIYTLLVKRTTTRAILNKKRERILNNNTRDQSVYFIRRIHDHNVIITHLSIDIDGIIAAAFIVKDIIKTFRRLRFELIISIKDDILHFDKDNNIRLKDVVMS